MLSLDTAYRSFGGEVEASSTPTICRLPDSCRHQLSAIARCVADKHSTPKVFEPIRRPPRRTPLWLLSLSDRLHHLCLPAVARREATAPARGGKDEKTGAKTALSGRDLML